MTSLPVARVSGRTLKRTVHGPYRADLRGGLSRAAKAARSNSLVRSADTSSSVPSGCEAALTVDTTVSSRSSAAFGRSQWHDEINSCRKSRRTASRRRQITSVAHPRKTVSMNEVHHSLRVLLPATVGVNDPLVRSFILARPSMSDRPVRQTSRARIMRASGVNFSMLKFRRPEHPCARRSICELATVADGQAGG